MSLSLIGVCDAGSLLFKRSRHSLSVRQVSTQLPQCLVAECRLTIQHIPSNPSTGFRPNPTPRQIADTPVLLQRATAFLRRELRIWGLADVEFLLTYVLNLLKAIDLRSEPFIRLLRDVLEPDTLTTMADGDGRHRDRERGEMRQYPNAAEHLAHELHSWLRSPFKELWRWDALAQVSLTLILARCHSREHYSYLEAHASRS